jgi:hypothetical protein
MKARQIRAFKGNVSDILHPRFLRVWLKGKARSLPSGSVNGREPVSNDQTVLFKKKYSSSMKSPSEMYPMLIKVYHEKTSPAIKVLK